MKNKLIVIAGPCVVENKYILEQVADKITMIANKFDIDLIFKSSYRKANRTKLEAFTGIGDKLALGFLADIRKEYGIRVTSDIHSAEEAELAAKYVDVIQIPAFLSRQTDILIAAGKTGMTVNIKKGQFMSVDDIKYAISKIRSTGNKMIMVTERGSSFGYDDLVIDFRNIPLIQNCLNTYYTPVIVDVTHSLGKRAGNFYLTKLLAKAAIAAGADGIFVETHPDCENAFSDGKRMIPLDRFEELIYELVL